ncbi:MAG: multiheme c-type cytochrome [Candidatus Aminicenantales bacterium]
MNARNIWPRVFAVLLVLAGGIWVSAEEREEVLAPVSDQTEECLDCHRLYTPGIVEDWLTSEHAHGTPAFSLRKAPLEREVSRQDVPESLLNVAVGCYECHSQNPDKHKDNFEHFEYRINMVVSPRDCAVCHEEEAKQYLGSKKANAHFNLSKNPVYHMLVETITSLKAIESETIIQGASSDEAKAETCYACHGTVVGVEGFRTLETDLGEIQVPVLTNWPNQGVGRVNPDGTPGACTACHPRHSFAVEIARKPNTCSQCHLEPDVPAWNVYRESKHGNIFASRKDRWNWGRIPWVVGEDFQAPTCAVCHNSLLVSPEGEVVAERSHDFGARLWVRIFGLIYSHPQPKNGQTFRIKNKDGLPLPTAFTGELASEGLIDAAEQKNRQQKMKKVCLACHGPTWTEGHFVRLARTIRESDRMVEAATKLLVAGWEKGLADRANPFDEVLEQKWVLQWLFYANSLRYASAMSGPDYAAFKNGWWALTKNLREMKKMTGK